MIILYKIASISKTIVRRKRTSTSKMQCLLSYSRAFEEDYGVHLVNMRIVDILEEMTYANFLGTNSKAAHLRYIRDGKMMLNHQRTLSLFVKLVKCLPAAKTIGITHLVDLSLYTFSEEEIVLMIQPTDTFLKKDHETAPFHVNSFSKRARAFSNELPVRNLEQEKEKFPNFALFLDTKIHQTKTISLSWLYLCSYVLCVHSPTMQGTDQKYGGQS